MRTVTSLFPRLPMLCLAALICWPPSALLALNPVVTKLLPRGGGDRTNNFAGTGVALSDRYILMGEPGDDTVANDAGAVHVYDARTGRYLRKLTDPDGQAGDRFGASVAVSGFFALVGADRGDGAVVDSGTASVFELRTSQRLQKLFTPTGAANDAFGSEVSLDGEVALVGAFQRDGSSGSAFLFGARSGLLIREFTAEDAGTRFGRSVCLAGRLALIGAPFEDPGGINNAGVAYLFDISTGERLHKWQAADAAATNFFGRSVAISGNRAIVGALGASGFAGAAYVFDLTTGAELHRLSDASGGQFGVTVSLSGNLALVGAPFADGNGAAIAFDATTGEPLGKLSAPDAAAGDQFGWRVALWGNQAVVGADRDDESSVDSGAAYLYRPLSGPLAMPAVAASRDFAPGVIEGDYARFFEAFVNEDGEALFRATLTGPGAARGKNQALFHTLGTGQTVALAAQSGATDLGGGAVAARLATPILNRQDRGIFEAVLRGPGINGTNNRAVYQTFPGGAPVRLFGTGEPLGVFGGAVMSRWFDLVQDRRNDTGSAGLAAVSFQLRPGVGGAGRADDSGVLRFRSDANLDGHREGATNAIDQRSGGDVPLGVALGQFLPRLAMQGNRIVHFATFLQSDPASNQGLFRAFEEPSLVARKGEAAPDQGAPFLTTANYHSFLAETSRNDPPLYRATLRGPGVNVRNNDAIFGETSRVGTVEFEALARKGHEPDPVNFPGQTYRRFLQFWPAGPNYLILAQLGGPGVNAGNDLALFLMQEEGTLLPLLREGDPVPGSDGARVGVIQRLTADHVNGHYAILTSLVGGKPGANLALWTGHTLAGDVGALQTLRLPTLQLRKGTAYQRITGETVIVKSFSFPNTADRGGAGGKGNGQVINRDGVVALCVEFTNRGKEVLVGKP